MPELTGQMLHFAYGDDLPHAEFKRLCPSAEWFGPARLEEHRLIFDSNGRASIRSDASSTIWGALWLVPASSLAVLDGHAGDDCERTTRRIISPAGPRAEATLYISKKTGESMPSEERIQTLLASAKENRLPAAYLAELKSVFRSRARSGEDSR